MYLAKILKSLFPLTLLCSVWAQVASAELNDFLPDGQEPTPMTGGVYLADTADTEDTEDTEVAVCPYNQICTGDIVLITLDTDLSPLNRTLMRVTVLVADDPYDLSKIHFLVQGTGPLTGPNFHGFYYRVKPGKTYYFKAKYSYRDKGKKEFKMFTRSVYYKARGDVHNPGGPGREGRIHESEAKKLGLPPIMPKCVSARSPGDFCINQMVHVFWSNDRGVDKSLLDIDLYINDQHIKHVNGPDYRGSLFHDFYYILPDSKDSVVPGNFKVTWTVRGYRKPLWPSHYESASLLGNYTPGMAYACQLTDSWEKCQYYRQED